MLSECAHSKVSACLPTVHTVHIRVMLGRSSPVSCRYLDRLLLMPVDNCFCQEKGGTGANGSGISYVDSRQPKGCHPNPATTRNKGRWNEASMKPLK